MRLPILSLVVGAATVAAGLFALSYFTKTPPTVLDVTGFVHSLIPTATVVPATAPEAAPAPLRGPKTPRPSNNTLDANGVIAATNVQRAANGLPALKFNAVLTAAAQTKANDLFAKQYFEHVSPSGTTPTQLIEAAGYKALANGENLAEGNFNGDIALVAAWMASPGHRANILSTHYTEIGVAVMKGTYEGYPTWMAVQEFGKPTSACPAPTAERKAFDVDQAEAIAQAKALETKPDEGDQAAVDAYNQKVDTYNALVAKIKVEVKTLNTLIDAYNACIRG